MLPLSETRTNSAVAITEQRRKHIDSARRRNVLHLHYHALQEDTVSGYSLPQSAETVTSRWRQTVFGRYPFLSVDLADDIIYKRGVQTGTAGKDRYDDQKL